jgi:hypothetical protein
VCVCVLCVGVWVVVCACVCDVCSVGGKFSVHGKNRANLTSK